MFSKDPSLNFSVGVVECLLKKVNITSRVTNLPLEKVDSIPSGFCAFLAYLPPQSIKNKQIKRVPVPDVQLPVSDQLRLSYA